MRYRYKKWLERPTVPKKQRKKKKKLEKCNKNVDVVMVVIALPTAVGSVYICHLLLLPAAVQKNATRFTRLRRNELSVQIVLDSLLLTSKPRALV
jgi:hypothetical protein